MQQGQRQHQHIKIGKKAVRVSSDPPLPPCHQADGGPLKQPCPDAASILLLLYLKGTILAQKFHLPFIHAVMAGMSLASPV
mmetsp:Transcript_17420/g.25830  ORF Transcript_17420/g.25830 Transcript_17420/m.25830 type:complete len:81 (+) Transcript_17420:141-383(+)